MPFVGRKPLRWAIRAFLASCAIMTLGSAASASAGVPADCNSNGIDDTFDVAAGTSDDCNSNGMPDECELTIEELNTLLADDGAPGDQFGASVAVSGDIAVIGAPGDDDNGSQSGSAYVFRRTGGLWQQVAKLTPADGIEWANFGRSVALYGELAFIGAPWDDDNGIDSGSVYVFRDVVGSWLQVAKLVASDGAAGDQFGLSVATYADMILIGAPFDDIQPYFDRGSVYVFRNQGGTWQETGKLIAADGRNVDYFGTSVAFDGDTAVIGAYGDDDVGPDSGSVYVFSRAGDTWYEDAKLAASDGTAGDWFGYSVGIDGNAVIVGARRDDDVAQNSGAAYLFRQIDGSWTEEAKLTAGDGVAWDELGYSVGVRGQLAFAGTYDWDDSTSSVYVYRDTNGLWQQIARFTANDSVPYYPSGFGHTMAADNDTLIVGAWFLTDAGSDSTGAAYYFSLGNDCNGNGVPDDCDIAGATSIDCNNNSIPDDCIWSEIDCNGNGVPDECDIASGASIDCNGDGYPDDCGSFAIDCNDNGVPDECDIAGGASPDCDQNGSPDSCDLESAAMENLYPEDATSSQQFGWSVAMSGARALIGANAENGRAAYLFREVDGEWQQVDKLMTSNGALGDDFASNVALSGELAVVGAHADSEIGPSRGAAYIFEPVGSSWQEIAKLTSDSVFDEEYWFGRTVAASEDTIAVGATLNSFGLVYVFQRLEGSWQQSGVLSSVFSSDGYGIVAVDGTTIIVGAPQDEALGYESGAAYVYHYKDGAWQQVATLTASDGVSHLFGASVSISGDTAMIGAPTAGDVLIPGAAYVYRRVGDEWVGVAKLTASDAVLGVRFGSKVSLAGKTAVIGAPADPWSMTEPSAAYVFREVEGVWQEIAKVSRSFGSEPPNDPFFGLTVAVNHSAAMAGYWRDSGAGGNSGTVHVFDFRRDCNGNGVPDDCEFAWSDCNSNGVPDECDMAAAVLSDTNGDGVADECQLPGDFDGDGNVGLIDHTAFLECFFGPGAPPAPTQPVSEQDCLVFFDVDGDGDVDLVDFHGLMRIFER
jgi:hypothetical protein